MQGTSPERQVTLQRPLECQYYAGIKAVYIYYYITPISFWDSLSEKICTVGRGGVIYNELAKRQNKKQESIDSEGIDLMGSVKSDMI